MPIYSIWEGERSGITLMVGPEKPAYSGDDLDAVKVKEFEATSWNEACQVQYDHYGWGRYRPMGDWGTGERDSASPESDGSPDRRD
jgi:hypothetical protein